MYGYRFGFVFMISFLFVLAVSAFAHHYGFFCTCELNFFFGCYCSHSCTSSFFLPYISKYGANDGLLVHIQHYYMWCVPQAHGYTDLLKCSFTYRLLLCSCAFFLYSFIFLCTHFPPTAQMMRELMHRLTSKSSFHFLLSFFILFLLVKSSKNPRNVFAVSIPKLMPHVCALNIGSKLEIILLNIQKKNPKRPQKSFVQYSNYYDPKA